MGANTGLAALPYAIFKTTYPNPSSLSPCPFSRPTTPLPIPEMKQCFDYRRKKLKFLCEKNDEFWNIEERKLGFQGRLW